MIMVRVADADRIVSVDPHAAQPQGFFDGAVDLGQPGRVVDDGSVTSLVEPHSG